jgi:hypothetical protein
LGSKVRVKEDFAIDSGRMLRQGELWELGAWEKYRFMKPGGKEPKVAHKDDRPTGPNTLIPR